MVGNQRVRGVELSAAGNLRPVGFRHHRFRRDAGQILAETIVQVAHHLVTLEAQARFLGDVAQHQQAHQQLKEELGLDHFEGRSYTGWHRHVTLTALAQAFCTLLRSDPKAPAPA